MLNIIAPENVDKLCTKFVGLGVHEDEDVLSAVIDVIFGKAVEEPDFSVHYSKLCKHQVEHEHALQIDKFRVQIAEKCRDSFNVESAEFREIIKERKEAMEAEPDEQKKKELDKEIATMKSKEKKRLSGLIK